MDAVENLVWWRIGERVEVGVMGRLNVIDGNDNGERMYKIYVASDINIANN